MSYHIRLGSFNIGCGWQDYKTMVAASKIELEKINLKFLELTTDKSEQEKFDLLQNDIEKSVAQRLSKQLDVICLQEVKKLNRTFIKTLEANGFKIYCIAKSNQYDERKLIDTAIAVKNGLFEDDVTNLTFESKSHPIPNYPVGQDIAVIAAKIKKTAITLAFSSIHSWGFMLYNEDDERRNYSDHDTQNMGYADSYIGEAIQSLNKTTTDLKFLLGDFNNNPHNYPNTFDLLENAGYLRLDPDAPTNINAAEFNYPLRKIDFIFSPNHLKTSFFKKIWTCFSTLIFSKTVVTVSDAKVLKGFDFTVEGNCSDHKPIGCVINIQTQSLFFRFLNFVLEGSATSPQRDEDSINFVR